MFDTLIQDLRYGVRSLFARPGFLIAAVAIDRLQQSSGGRLGRRRAASSVTPYGKAPPPEG